MCPCVGLTGAKQTPLTALPPCRELLGASTPGWRRHLPTRPPAPVGLGIFQITPQWCKASGPQGSPRGEPHLGGCSVSYRRRPYPSRVRSRGGIPGPWIGIHLADPSRLQASTERLRMWEGDLGKQADRRAQCPASCDHRAVSRDSSGGGSPDVPMLVVLGLPPHPQLRGLLTVPHH